MSNIIGNKLRARLINLHKTESEWSISSFIPALGEVVVYDPDETISYPRIKVGDGKNLVKDLPFISDVLFEESIQWDGDVGYIDSGSISDYS